MEAVQSGAEANFVNAARIRLEIKLLESAFICRRRNTYLSRMQPAEARAERAKLDIQSNANILREAMSVAVCCESIAYPKYSYRHTTYIFLYTGEAARDNFGAAVRKMLGEVRVVWLSKVAL